MPAAFTPLLPRTELRRRIPRLVAGLVLAGVGIALMVESDLGLGPWDVLHQGLSDLTGIGIGVVGILLGLPLMLLWIPLGQRVGIGTVINVALVGSTVDIARALLPTPEVTAARWAALLAGVALIGLGSGLYIGAGLGTGPRDGLMTGLAARGMSVRAVRTGMEVTVLVTGWLLGGTVGVGTVLFAFGIGPMVQAALGRFTVPFPFEPE